MVINDLTGEQIWGDKGIMCILPINDDRKPLEINYKGKPSELVGFSSDVFMSIFYETPRIIRCNLNGDCNLKLYGKWEGDVFHLSNEYKNTYIIRNKNVALTILDGVLTYENDCFYISSNESKNIELVIEQYYSGFFPKKYLSSRDECIRKVDKEFHLWKNYMPEVNNKYKYGFELASYINWSCMYEPRGNIGRYAMGMSKNRMIYIWSWDHCFNSLCLSFNLPKLSWDQFMIMFDHQDEETGAIPDLISSMTTIWRDKKPPIHGWILSELLKKYKPSKEELRDAYYKLSKWTNFWLKYRDEDGNGLPHYYNGLDSGWDNGTSFDVGTPTESADLAAFLILQMEQLSKIADSLGLDEEAFSWKTLSSNMLDVLLNELWNGDKFITRVVDSKAINKHSKSLMSYIPIILGKRLPENIRLKLIADLKREGDYITPYGIATESPNSELYVSDGYWRGPIWAPTTLIIVYGLTECGEYDLAKEISKRFCDNCLKNGMAENFDALTGKPLRDLSYTWTSSVFLILAHKYLS